MYYTGSNAFASLRQGLVGAWCPSLPNGGSGNTLADVSGHGNHGSLVNMSPDDWVSGQYGRALDFDGVDDYVAADGRFPTVGIATNFSASVWFYVTSVPSGRRQLSANPIIVANDFAPILEINGALTIRADNAGLAAYVFADSVNVPTNQWVHAAGVWDGGRKVASLYKNGVLIGTVDYTANAANNTNKTKWLLGALEYEGSVIHHLPGRIDDSRIYSRALS